MKEKLTANLGLKILSVLVAVILWIGVTSAKDPTITKTYTNIPVTLENTERITQEGKMYEILDNSAVISRVYVRAPQSVLSEISTQNITATADVSNLSSLNTVSIVLGTNVNQDKISSISGSSDTVKLSIENKKSKMLPLTVDITGEPAEGFVRGDYSTDQNQVRIQGPESYIDRAVTAKVTVDVSGFSSDVRTNSEIRLYDSEENIVTHDTINQNIKSVGVSVTILQTKEIAIHVSAPTQAQAGYRGTGLVMTVPETVMVKGRPSILSNVESVEVPAEAISLENQTESFTTNVDIRPYLPDGVSLVDASQAYCSVTVGVEAEASKRLGIATEDLKIVNAPEGFEVTSAVVEEGSMLELIGLSAQLDDITKDSLSPRVDMDVFMKEKAIEDPSALEEGFFPARISFTLPGGVTVLDPLYATIHIVKKE